MAVVYCALCERNVDSKRHFGIGTLILVLVTAGVWILAMPFYNKQCPFCTGTAFCAPATDDDLD